MKILTTLIFLIMFTACGGICNKQNACSSDDNSSTTNDDDKKSSEKVDPSDVVEVVIPDDDDLPECSRDNNNQTAYRESSEKFFICKSGAWEEFHPAGFDEKETSELSQKEIIATLWESAKTTLPEENYLAYFCASLLTVEPDHECQN